MAKHSEQPLSERGAALLQTSSRDGLKILGLDETTDAKKVVAAIDSFVWVWQQGKKPPADLLKPDVAHYALGSLWGDQLIRRFGWEWATVTFPDNGGTNAPAVLAPDRSLAVYPLHAVRDCLRDAKINSAIALSYNMLVEKKFGATKPGTYMNVVAYARQNPPRE